MGYLDGFGVTIGKWLGVQSDSGRRVTEQYPEEVRPKGERFHGRHVLNRYEDGMEKCIGCELCAGVCPARCIYVRGRDNDPEDPTSPGERYGYVYEINYLRCIHCDLCVEACPTEAITETKMFEFAFTNRADAIYTKDELLVGDDGRPRQLPWEHWEGGFDPARDTSGWMRATAPSGDADFVGIVAWAGELGYGVRPPERSEDEPAGDVGDDHGHDAHDDDHDGHGAGTHGAAEPAAVAEPVTDHTPGTFDLDEPPTVRRRTMAEEAPAEDTSAAEVIKDMTRQAGHFDSIGEAPTGARPTEAVPTDADQRASAGPSDQESAAAPAEPAPPEAPASEGGSGVDTTDDTADDTAAAPEPEPPAAPAPPTRAPGMFDADDEPEEPTRGRGWRRGKGGRR